MKFLDALAAGIIAAIRAARPFIVRETPEAAVVVDAFLRAPDERLVRDGGDATPPTLL